MTFDPAIVALITAVIGAIVSIISLVLSSKNQINLAHVQSNLSIKEKVKEEDRLLVYKQLSEFYDPILVLLEVNGDIFNRLGPGSPIRSNMEIPQEEIAEVWGKLLNDVILPNNDEIGRIVKAKLHLMSAGDEIAPYIKFVTHAHAYKIFRGKPISAYKFFQFPKGIENHVRQQREKLYEQIEIIKKA